MTGLAHLAWSTVPGWSAWLAIGIGEALIVGEHLVAFQSAPLLAFLTISVVTWSLSVPTVPLAGGILWLVVAGGVLASASGADLLRVGLRPEEVSGLYGLIEQTGALLLMPLLLIGPPGVDGPVLTALLSVVAVIGLAALGYIRISDWPLSPSG